MSEQFIEKKISHSDLARAFGVSKAAVSQWFAKKNGVPAERCPDIEALTGVRCEALRPDVNWSVLRNTTQDKAAA